MEHNLTHANQALIQAWIITICIFTLIFIGLISIKKMVWRHLEKLALKTSSQIDDAIIDELNRPISFTILICALGISLQFAPENIKQHTIATHGIRFILVLTAVWIVERIVSVLIHHANMPATITSSTRALFLVIARFIIFALGALVALDTIGISITPLLASLGVGSIAVALALQDTLGNFFSGLYLLLDRPFKLGDFVQFENDIQGTVTKIGWRSTQILLTTNCTAVMPNSKIASSKMTNFNSPNEETIFTVGVGVDYDCDLNFVEKVTVDVAREIQKSSVGGVPEFEPVVRFHTFADSSINFNVVLKSIKYGDQFILKHDFIKALHERYKKENISIPFPQRVIHNFQKNG